MVSLLDENIENLELSEDDLDDSTKDPAYEISKDNIRDEMLDFVVKSVQKG